MKPRFIELPEVRVIGISTFFIAIGPGVNAQQVIPPLWESFHTRFGEITERQGTTMFGLSIPAEGVEMKYLAGVEAAGPVPEGMEEYTMAAGRYAVFTHKGLIKRLPETYGQILGVWLPWNKPMLREGVIFELYDERYVGDTEESAFDICVPVK